MFICWKYRSYSAFTFEINEHSRIVKYLFPRFYFRQEVFVKSIIDLKKIDQIYYRKYKSILLFRLHTYSGQHHQTSWHHRITRDTLFTENPIEKTQINAPNILLHNL